MKEKKDKNEIVYESHNDSFSKSNTLISSKYKASLFEQKLLNVILAKLQQKKYVDEGEEGGLVCNIRAKELKDMFGSSSGAFYPQLKNTAEALTSRTIGFVNDDIQAFKYVSLLLSSTYMDGVLTVRFNHELKQYLTPQTSFTVLELPTLLSYKSIFSLRLHEILLSRCYKQKKSGVSKYTSKNNSDGRHYKIEFNLSELRLLLGVVNAESASVKRILNGSSTPDYDKAVEKATEKSFNTWYDFRRKVIDVAIKEINSKDNGMKADYEPMAGGRGGKVYGVRFFVELIDDKKEEKEPIKEVKVLTEDEMFDVQCEVKVLINEKLSVKDIRAICEAAEYDIDKIKKAYEIAGTSGDIENLVGFMVKAIREGYEKPVKKKAKSSKNKFNNFPQREYDFDEFEKNLLNQ